MEIFIASVSALCLLFAFVLGIETGIRLTGGNKNREAREENPRTSGRAKETDDEERRRFEEDRKAFALCMNYSPETAYGEGETYETR